MKRLIEFLFSGCWHEWETIRDDNVYDSYMSLSIPIGQQYTMRCKKCGEIKTYRNY